MNKTITLIVAFSLSGCAHSMRNLSDHVLFRPYVGASLTLQRSAALYDNGIMATYSLLSPKSLLNPDGSTNVLWKTERLTALPAGTPLEIKVVRTEYSKGFRYIEACGLIELRPGVRKKFDYIWGEFDTVFRAPWEPDSVSTSRRLTQDKKESNIPLHGTRGDARP